MTREEDKVEKCAVVNVSTREQLGHDTCNVLRSPLSKSPARASAPWSSRDNWLEEPEHWIRVHVVPRRAAFHPGRTRDGPGRGQISEFRITNKTYRDGTTSQIRDRWNDVGPDPWESRSWTGTTCFRKSSARGHSDRQAGPRGLPAQTQPRTPSTHGEHPTRARRTGEPADTAMGAFHVRSAERLPGPPHAGARVGDQPERGEDRGAGPTDVPGLQPAHDSAGQSSLREPILGVQPFSEVHGHAQAPARLGGESRRTDHPDEAESHEEGRTPVPPPGTRRGRDGADGGRDAGAGAGF